MQEHVQERTVAVSVRALKLGGRGLLKLFGLLIRAHKQMLKDKATSGKMEYKDLVRLGSGVTGQEIHTEDTAILDKICRKHGLRYSLRKDITQTPPKWTLWCESKNVEVLQQVQKELASRLLKKKGKNKDRPSLLEKLKKLKQFVKSANPAKVRNKTQEKTR
ncbi:DUF3801 domain-containing protein [Ethanoligenens sp.]|uniref:DUF3801 domain-containing protein n=1 Tax=Ethanoligenens sp. TaxID=2099655 RepID=UPI0039E9193E